MQIDLCFRRLRRTYSHFGFMAKILLHESRLICFAVFFLSLRTTIAVTMPHGHKCNTTREFGARRDCIDRIINKINSASACQEQCCEWAANSTPPVCLVLTITHTHTHTHTECTLLAENRVVSLRALAQIQKYMRIVYGLMADPLCSLPWLHGLVLERLGPVFSVRKQTRPTVPRAPSC